MATELEAALADLARRFGPDVLDDADGLGPLLDDLVTARDEQVRAKVVVDAVRLRSWQRLRDLRGHGAGADEALDSAADHLVQTRGGTDHASARWALSALGSATGVVAGPAGPPPVASARGSAPRAQAAEPPPTVEAPPPTALEPPPTAPEPPPTVSEPPPTVSEPPPTVAAPPPTVPGPQPGPQPAPQPTPQPTVPSLAWATPEPPVMDTPPRRERLGMSRRTIVVLSLAVLLAVAGGVGVAMAMSDDPGAGDDPAASDGSDDGRDAGTGNGGGDPAAAIQEEFGTLGAWDEAAELTCDPASGGGKQDAMDCQVGDHAVRLVNEGDAEAFAATREEWVRRVKAEPDAVMTRTPEAMVVHDASAGRVYWDSAEAQQSAVLEVGSDDAAAVFEELVPDLALPAPPSPLPSTELLDFAPDGMRAAGCHPDPEVPAGPDEITQLFCPLGDGYEVRLAEVVDRATLLQERDDLMTGIRPEPGTLRPGDWFVDADAERPAGAIIEFIHSGHFDPEDEGEARLYWDDPECLCWAVLWAPDGDQTALRDQWLDGSRVAAFETP